MNLAILKAISNLISEYWKNEAGEIIDSFGIKIAPNENVEECLKRLNKEGDYASIIKITNTLLMDSTLQAQYNAHWQIGYNTVEDLVESLFTLFKAEGFEVDKFQIKSSGETQARERTYNSGQEYDFYSDIREITLSAKDEVFVIDPYVTEDVINLYLDKLPIGIRINILTKDPKDNFEAIAKKFKQKHGSNFVVRLSNKCHDRLFFVDKKCYVIGQSLDKAASNKPTYILEIQSSGLCRNIFQPLFDNGKTLV